MSKWRRRGVKGEGRCWTISELYCYQCVAVCGSRHVLSGGSDRRLLLWPKSPVHNQTNVAPSHSFDNAHSATIKAIAVQRHAHAFEQQPQIVVTAAEDKLMKLWYGTSFQNVFCFVFATNTLTHGFRDLEATQSVLTLEGHTKGTKHLPSLLVSHLVAAIFLMFILRFRSVERRNGRKYCLQFWWRWHCENLGQYASLLPLLTLLSHSLLQLLFTYLIWFNRTPASPLLPPTLLHPLPLLPLAFVFSVAFLVASPVWKQRTTTTLSTTLLVPLFMLLICAISLPFQQQQKLQQQWQQQFQKYRLYQGHVSVMKVTSKWWWH